ncbi:MAG: DMT family transporter [Clostridia bacterium]|nr:DMT family transporter [Clostridia bacterium]
MNRRVVAALVVAVVAVSFSSIFIRYSDAPAIALSFYRLALSLPILAALGLAGARRRARTAPAGPAGPGGAGAATTRIRRWLPASERAALRDVAAMIASGVFLALHFAVWIASLEYTTVASSVVLVTSHPLLVGVLAMLLGDDRLPPGAYLGGALAVLGTALIGWGDYALGGTALYGDLLAFLGAVFISGYILIGRHVRRHVDNLAYTLWVYAAAAAALAAIAAFAGVPLWPYPAGEWLIFLALAVVPTIFGHTLFNWALGHVPAAAVSIVILGEPVGSTLLAWLFLGEVPTAGEMIGGAVILAGLVYFSLAMRNAEASSPATA